MLRQYSSIKLTVCRQKLTCLLTGAACDHRVMTSDDRRTTQTQTFLSLCPTHTQAHLDNTHCTTGVKEKEKLAATLRGSRPGVQSASLIMTSLMTS